nr:hypothetical protein CFP56_14484 [Quercus suber]
MEVAVAKEDRDTRIEKACERHVRSRVAISDSFNTQLVRPILENLQSTAFEKQLCDIDAAIVGEMSISEQPLNLDTVQVISAELMNTA